jgi:hypothetical protein
VFKGEGDAYHSKEKETLDRRNPSITRESDGSILMSEGDAFREYLHKNRRTDSSGSILAYEGLLLGMWAEGRRNSRDEAPPHNQTFALTIIHDK